MSVNDKVIGLILVFSGLITGCNGTDTTTSTDSTGQSSTATVTPQVTTTQVSSTSSTTTTTSAATAASTSSTATTTTTHAAPTGHGIYVLLVNQSVQWIPLQYGADGVYNGLNSTNTVSNFCYYPSYYFTCYMAVGRDVWEKGETLPPGIDAALGRHDSSVSCQGHSTDAKDTLPIVYTFNNTGTSVVSFDTKMSTRTYTIPYEFNLGVDAVSIACQ